jgi:hypothetical protein
MIALRKDGRFGVIVPQSRGDKLPQGIEGHARFGGLISVLKRGDSGVDESQVRGRVMVDRQTQ